MRRTSGRKPHVANRHSRANGRQDMLPIRRFRFCSVEEDRMDFVMRSKEALKVIGCDGTGVNLCIQAADPGTGLQHIP